MTMLDKVRKPSANRGKWTVKNIVAICLFAAIIAVFALFGINNHHDMGSGGAAAVVNDTAITISEFRNRVQNMEQQMKGRFDQLPEATRKQMSQEMRVRALEQLIQDEIVFQEAKGRGVIASDVEVRDQILAIPVFSENGRFKRDRYQMFLAQMGISVQDFERQIRKQIVSQRLQDLFVGSAAPTQEELKRARELSSQKLSVRFLEFDRNDLSKPGFISDEEVRKFEAANAAEIEKYYKDNKVTYSKPERMKARHILIRSGDKRSDAEAAKLAADLKAKVNKDNFSKLASENSDDPGSKAKGGELGEFERGRMVPEFEKAAFELKEGQISSPIKTDFGYHIILVDKKMPAETESLDKVRTDIARTLVARAKQEEILAQVRATIEKGSKKDVEAFAAKSGLKWGDSGEFDLSASSIPKIGEAPALMTAVLQQGKGGGFIPKMIEAEGRFIVADVSPWKTGTVASDVEGADRMAAYRKSADIIEAWSKDAMERAEITRNSNLTRQ